MKFYLSSYKIGDNPQDFARLFGQNKKIAVISNAIDFRSEEDRKESEIGQMNSLVEIGLEPKVLDLKKYFGKKNELEQELKGFAGIWVRGGNTFVLRAAYRLSGFDEIIGEYIKSKKDFVYGGYSAGVSVLQQNLKGTDLVDDPNLVKTTYSVDVIWEGLGILDYVFVPHFESDHPESEAVNEEVKYYIKNKIVYKTLRDGEVIITEV